MFAIVMRWAASRLGRPGPAVLEDLARAPAHGEPPQELEDHVLGRHPRLQRAGEPDADDGGHREEVRATAQGHRDVETARARWPACRPLRRAACGCRCRAASGPGWRSSPCAPGGRCRCRAWRRRRRTCARPPACSGGRRSCASRPGRRCGRRSSRPARGTARGKPMASNWSQRHGAVGVGEEHLIDADADLLAGDRLAGDEVAARSACG